ncbi:MAG: hypothetical protein P4M00_15565 [Azospirillaceae bacterium]|nr:hypothetical protein [Azospirillaceae bacterium]
MTKTDFDKFVERQQAKQQEEAAFDHKKQLQKWLEYLDTLYKQINGYLEKYITNGAATITYRDVIINEDFIGPYAVQELILKIGLSTITFKPIGTMVIGTKGRVDVQGPRGSARLSLVNKQVTSARELVRVTVLRSGDPTPTSLSRKEIENIEWAWKIVTPAPQMQFIDLTPDAFFDMVLSVADA